MKNNILKYLPSVLFINLFMPESVQAISISQLPVFKVTIAKFSLVMIGLLVFSFVLYIGLSIYNKFFVDEKIKDYRLRKESLRTPRDKDEAVMMFIAKNRLK